MPLLALAHNNPPTVSEVYILTEEGNIFGLIYAMSLEDERDPWFSFVCNFSPPFGEYVLFFPITLSKSKFLCLVFR